MGHMPKRNMVRLTKQNKTKKVKVKNIRRTANIAYFSCCPVMLSSICLKNIIHAISSITPLSWLMYLLPMDAWWIINYLMRSFSVWYERLYKNSGFFFFANINWMIDIVGWWCTVAMHNHRHEYHSGYIHHMRLSSFDANMQALLILYYLDVVLVSLTFTNCQKQHKLQREKTVNLRPIPKVFCSILYVTSPY
jgi:hypothetical protein